MAKFVCCLDGRRQSAEKVCQYLALFEVLTINILVAQFIADMPGMCNGSHAGAHHDQEFIHLFIHTCARQAQQVQLGMYRYKLDLDKSSNRCPLILLMAGTVGRASAVTIPDLHPSACLQRPDCLQWWHLSGTRLL